MNRVLVAAAIIERDGKLLLARRSDGGARDGSWEFPGGKIEADETPEAALVREIREELGVTIITGKRLATVEWDYADISVCIIGISASFAGDGIGSSPSVDRVKQVELVDHVALVDHDSVTWASVEEARRLPLLPADRAMLDVLSAERPER